MSPDAHLNELGEFLKARRAELSPRTVGLPDSPGPRRVAGLRREEVARLAAISTDYYTRLEQGRMQASAPVLDSLAQALHLDDDQRGYLFGLAGKEIARPRRRTRQKVQPQLRRLLDDLTVTPAVVMGRRMDVIAWNQLAAALITDFGKLPEKDRNYVRVLFTDPAMRTLYADWKTVARTCVAQLRMEAAKYPDDPRLTALVGELSVQDPDFRTWWAGHHVAALNVGTKTLHHPVAGELALDWDTLTATTDPDQQLVIWTAEVGGPTHDGLRILASWAADQPLTAMPAG
ncbi:MULTISPECIES: helix-turn-helix transcriptional regulator [unclassified Streptomyces]|uniref:helix-turn-helix domain-containing protein n=1 Tax=Streptomyces TaxID=1883 RepID=UPI0001C1AB85|nr:MULTISPECIES: helix-turn-helix transcriptional regulator [unclassified Streptomyces]AEN13893.1 helix-turn-helix domain protein [Streptomyces sp. SirexAA-E]MYR67875.1 helix-turn-helix domain-containing protein [Streptomyces sp. SID4939]MYS00295.1 helix-turn-helix domain-containing protein [Streptomyces sp. SID4940]MYT67782.1 helix-turn-helix domain-containing protein [Streptomyces sp. SID8357]MYT86626.1 helix-turn-helix domain-containing protein [Streptomyces sp. SID8360]